MVRSDPESLVAGVLKDYLLLESDRDANVVLHVVSDGQYPYPDSRLRLAADLAEHRGPREELLNLQERLADERR